MSNKSNDHQDVVEWTGEDDLEFGSPDASLFTEDVLRRFEKTRRKTKSALQGIIGDEEDGEMPRRLRD
ncbi:MAG: hypothetical protein AAB728_03270 [Patescibacteria group bacterium]